MNHPPPTPKGMTANTPVTQLPCSTAMEMNTTATIKYASAKITTPTRAVEVASAMTKAAEVYSLRRFCSS
jgi:hypothetical protein